MNCRLSLPVIFAALALGGCRNPATAEPPDGGEQDGGEDAGGPRAPCAAQMNPDLGLLPTNSPQKGGEAEVDVVVNIFSSLRCPHCARLAEIADILWRRPEWQGRVRLYFRHMGSAAELHAATAAAYNQSEDAFWALHDEIFFRLREEGEYMTMPEILDFAEETLGLDMAQFDADMHSEETGARLAEDRATGEALGVTATPAVFLCDEQIPASTLERRVSEFL